MNIHFEVSICAVKTATSEGGQSHIFVVATATLATLLCYCLCVWIIDHFARWSIIAEREHCLPHHSHVLSLQPPITNIFLHP